MSDILDNYISKIDRGGISKKINYYILKLKHKKDGFIKSFTFKFEIIKIEFQLKINQLTYLICFGEFQTSLFLTGQLVILHHFSD